MKGPVKVKVNFGFYFRKSKGALLKKLTFTKTSLYLNSYQQYLIQVVILIIMGVDQMRRVLFFIKFGRNFVGVKSGPGDQITKQEVGSDSLLMS